MKNNLKNKKYRNNKFFKFYNYKLIYIKDRLRLYYSS